jgi:arginine-tRNA-protein transferase
VRLPIAFTDHEQDLSSWEGGDINNAKSLKGVIGELVACIGPDAARAVAINFN